MEPGKNKGVFRGWRTWRKQVAAWVLTVIAAWIADESYARAFKHRPPVRAQTGAPAVSDSKNRC